MLELIQPFDTPPSRTSVKLKCETSTFRMPVDFASYLLSSSPPAFELNYSLRDHFGMGLHRPRSLTPAAARPVDKSDSLPNLREQPQVEEVHTSHSDDDHDVTDKAWSCEDENDQQEPPQSPTDSLGRKRVSFADECGRNLVSVRLLTESSDTPPNIRPQILNSLLHGSCPGVTQASPLMLNFSQPASNYLAFREKIEKDCISLENVIIKDHSLMGTVKVKNIAFEKSVKVRCTFDSWETSQDFAANFVPNSQNVYDTFAFEIRVPPTLNVRKKVQFCICYTVNNTDYWDSNNGDNYEVVSADWKEPTKGSGQNTTDYSVYNLHAEPNWTQFSGWDNMDSSCPYW